MKKYFLLFFTLIEFVAIAQNVMTPEQLITLNKVSPIGMSDDNNFILFKISTVDLEQNISNSKTFALKVGEEKAIQVLDLEKYLTDKKVSPDGKYRILTEEVKILNVAGQDFYEDVPNSNVQIYDNLNYRHWDTWEDGKFSHVFLQSESEKIDLMKDEPYDCPQMPFGGDEDYIWNPDGTKVLYVTKKSFGKEYAISTNSDIYEYDLSTRITTNITQNNAGYDVAPSFSSKGELAWLQMKNDGYESDKNDIIIRRGNNHINLTEKWDGTVSSYLWSNDGTKIYFNAPVLGTEHLFEIEVKENAKPKQITKGQFNVNALVGQKNNSFFVSRTDMNRAAELYSVDLKSGKMEQITHVNDAIYAQIILSKVEKRITKTVDGKDLLSWVIYPPNFDPTKKYPTLLYCQGGPQGALSQFYSVRWNFQLMAANGYIVIAPNRRGMPGYGVEWNEQISKDYGGLNMQDYLAAIDDLAKETYVDKERLGCVGASYGGYSAFYLAAIHENRFKTFIAHDGIFNWKSMYGTTEELFFVNWDLGGSYWDKKNQVAQKSYTIFNPSENVEKWNTPILIIQGGKDFRVPIGQGLEAFQAAQLLGIKSRLLYFPEENHWVLDYQNSLVWHREFYKWLKETL